MSGQQVALLLHECLQRALSGPAETVRALPHHSGLFPHELSTLLQEAADRKWPFVEEKWQYKQSVMSEDKTNSSDLIRRHLPELLIFLRDSIIADEPKWAVAVVFLIDRLLYWMDSSHVLLKIAKALHERYPEVPIAPQVIIRQARVYLNSGKLQKSEFILSSLISNNGLTGSWTYMKVSDQTLVQTVSLQVRGQVLQMLGLWIDAFELIWASLVGFYALPQPDKKGIGTSLGLLAQTLISMNDRDFDALQKKTHIDFSLLGEDRHRLLSAARAAKMAVVYSQYGSLYVLTNVVAQGMCLLSYSFSDKCSSEDQRFYLALAKEAFEIGLLTNTTDNTVTSKLELHTLLKASFCLAVTHRWMTGPSENIGAALKACQEAVTLLFRYSTRADFTVCTDIVTKIRDIKSLLNVQCFRNSDSRSFIPDGYRSVEFGPVMFALRDFTKLIDGFKKHHRFVCETFRVNEKRREGDRSSTRRIVTAFQIDTEAATEETHNRQEVTGSRQNSSSSGSSCVLVDLSCQTKTCTDEESGFHRNGGHVSNQTSPSKPNGANALQRVQRENPLTREMCTTEDEDEPAVNISGDAGKKAKASGSISSTLDTSYVHIPAQSNIETVEDIQNPFTPPNAQMKTTDGSTSSLDDSIGSRSSWDKLSISPVTDDELSQMTDRSLDNHKIIRTSALSTNESDPFEELGFEHLAVSENHQDKMQSVFLSHESCDCFRNCVMGSDVMTERDYRRLFAGVCHNCLIKRLPDSPVKALDTRRLNRAYRESPTLQVYSKKTSGRDGSFNPAGAVVLKYSKASDVWMGFDSCVFIGEQTGHCGTQRRAVELQYLHQEQLLSRYVGKEYLQEKSLHAHLHDVERQMSAQHYVTEFNKRLYDNDITAQIFFIPSEVLLVLEMDRIVTCLSAEPYMSGDFLKLTNNTKHTKTEHAATKYGIAFGHFTYEFSNHEEVVVDLQGWVTSNGKGLTYLTDPQIHSLRNQRTSNFKQTGINYFIQYQHGNKCNEICRAAGLKNIK